ncbi:MAG TPA: lysophospholipid acyltransferase family protein [Parvularculaceae bacterium]|nr:lysophospholipid acyltransferase family protein [Parvularculaceae bacterium]
MSATSDIDEIPLPEPRSNRPVTLAHRIEFALALALGAVFRLIGVDAASAIAGGFTRLVGPMIGPIQHRGRINLGIAFPSLSDAEAAAILRRTWENLGRTTAEFAHLEKFDPDLENARVEIIGRERLEKIAQGDAPAIFVSGHFGNWEVMSIALHAIGVDYGVIYRAANNPLIDGLIIKERARVMSRRQIPKGKRGGRDMIDALKSGASLAMLVDQKLNTGGVPSPFFGKPAMTAPAAARLALKYSAPVIPIEIERLKGARFRVTAHQPIEFAASGDVGADTQSLTDLINLEIEKIIRARPGQWLWLHRRWGKEEYR